MSVVNLVSVLFVAALTNALFLHPSHAAASACASRQEPNQRQARRADQSGAGRRHAESRLGRKHLQRPARCARTRVGHEQAVRHEHHCQLDAGAEPTADGCSNRAGVRRRRAGHFRRLHRRLGNLYRNLGDTAHGARSSGLVLLIFRISIPPRLRSKAPPSKSAGAFRESFTILN